MSAVDAFVAAGSNIEPEANVAAALRRLMGSVRVVASSTFYQTPPLGRPEQPPFLNGVWRIATLMAPLALKHDVLRGIESALGRVRSADPYAARPIDLDLVLYGDLVVGRPELHLPDPDIRSRPFVAAPLLELAPTLIMPDSGEPLAWLPSASVSPDMQPALRLTQHLRALIDGRDE